jgi:hypothetical protein
VAVGKHANHGGNVQVITVPGGWPIWTCAARPGREHDTTAVRTHAEILPALAIAAEDLQFRRSDERPLFRVRSGAVPDQ